MQHTQRFLLNLVAHAENWAKSENVEGKEFDFEGNVFVGKGKGFFVIGNLQLFTIIAWGGKTIVRIHLNNKPIFSSQESAFEIAPSDCVKLLKNFTNIPFEVKQEIVLNFWAEYCKKKFLGVYFTDGCTADFPYLLWIESFNRGEYYENKQAVKTAVTKENNGSYLSGYILTRFEDKELIENRIVGLESNLIVERFYSEIMKLHQ